MITISLCMIVKNEEAVLGRCLESVKDAVDEIIIVDTGSDDKTIEIAKGFTDKVYSFAWVNDFSAARNEAYSKAGMDYQLWLDADDVLPPAQREKLIALKHSLKPDVDIVTMKYHTHFAADGSPTLTSTRERLTRRDKNYKWQDPVHECIPLIGNILYTDIEIWHKKEREEGVSTRNLDIYGALEVQGKPLTPRQQYYFARELKDHGSYAKSVYYFEKFLDGGQGWGEDNIAACFSLAICHKALGDSGKILPALLKSFLYDSPRAEICCELGYYYKGKSDYKTALGWFRTAADMEQPDALGFILRDYWGYIPNIECCVCCCELGAYGKAKEYNERAAAFKPDNEAVAINRRVLQQFDK